MHGSSGAIIFLLPNYEFRNIELRMTRAEVYSFQSYRTFLEFHAKEQEPAWGALTRLAKAAGCHRPYLSKVLSGEAHLTSAQLYALANYWELSEPQTEYLLRLLEIEKASQAEYRKYLVQKNDELRRREENLSQLVARQASQPNSQDVLYYSSWVWSAVHILTSIPAYQTVKAIAEKLSLPAAQVESILEALQKWGSVRLEREKWKFAANEHHVTKENPLVTFHHSNWRNRALADSQRQTPESIHFTVVQSVSHEDYERIRQLILELIGNASKIAGPSKEEKMFCFTCDFFEP